MCHISYLTCPYKESRKQARHPTRAHSLCRVSCGSIWTRSPHFRQNCLDSRGSWEGVLYCRYVGSWPSFPRSSSTRPCIRWFSLSTSPLGRSIPRIVAWSRSRLPVWSQSKLKRQYFRWLAQGSSLGSSYEFKKRFVLLWSHRWWTRNALCWCCRQIPSLLERK